MKNIRKDIWVWIQAVIFIGTWVALSGLSVSWESLKKLPDVVALSAVFYFVFSKWLWRLPWLQGWLVPFPDLEGTWEGTLQTTWQDPKTKVVPGPIPMYLVVKQSFDSISCVMYTQESSSFSTAAGISEDDDSGIKTLSYNYSNRPDVSVRNRSVVHDGAAVLQIVSKPKRALKGEYWTNRKSTGGITLNFKTKELIEQFPSK
jgi:hypothetical protein